MSDVKIDIVVALAETYGRTLSDAAAMLYVAALSGLSDQDAQRAASIAVQRSKFFPSAAELIELASTGGVGFEAQAMVAFEQLEVALNQNKPSAMPPLVAAIVNQLGGFELLRTMPLADFNTWKRKDFLSAHATLCRENPERLAALAGPHSEIAGALELKRVPQRHEIAATEESNRQKILALPR
jgi:hypothetical protein